MACFVIPGGEAVITTVVQKIVEKKEKKNAGKNISKPGLSWSRKLSWLNKLLWGGTILLAFEHIWHGEVMLWPPFLTAIKNPSEIGPMLHEMVTIGVSMALFVTIVWAAMVIIAEKIMAEDNLKAEYNIGGE